jgi:heptosyltransferase-2
MEKRGKILVIRGGAIGDFILTLPAIAALRRQFPHTQLEVLGYPHIVQLALAGQLVDRIRSIEARALAGFFARGGALEADLADYFSECDLIVSYLFDPDDIFRTNVARCSPAQFIAGPHRPDEKQVLHASKVFLKPLERLAIFEADPVPRLKVGQASRLTRERVSASEKLFVGSGGFTEGDRRDGCSTLALHPGSGSEKKNWPESKWSELLRHLIDSTPANLLLISGEAEGERVQRLAAALPSDRIRLAHHLPLTELAMAMQECAAFVGHDSGISHLAAALGLPVLLLWGDSVKEIWRPPQENVVILKHVRALKEIELEQVVAELDRLVRR